MTEFSGQQSWRKQAADAPTHSFPLHESSSDQAGAAACAGKTRARLAHVRGIALGRWLNAAVSL